jgi:hypothetical protein
VFTLHSADTSTINYAFADPQNLYAARGATEKPLFDQPVQLIGSHGGYYPAAAVG